MITNITSQELEFFLAKEHPAWHAQSVHNHANEYSTSIDERLAIAIEALVKSGERIDFQYGEFSLYLSRLFVKIVVIGTQSFLWMHILKTR